MKYYVTGYDRYESFDIPVYYEGVFGNLIAEVADKTKATVAAHVFYQDPGTGESRSYMNMFCNGKWM